MSESERFLIRRVPAPRWIGSGRHPDPERVYDALGEQAEWGFADPWMYRALASPLTYEPMLRAPKRGDDVTHGPVAYWSSLLHLIVYGFGWVRPDRGLRWWYQNGRPLADDHLRLISQVWDADEQLNYFVAWLWTTPRILEASLVAEATGYIMDDDMPLRPDDRWTDEQVSWAEALKLPGPVGGGWDPCHLSRHIDGPLQPVRGNATLLRTGRSKHHAVLLLDSMVGWYRALAAECKALPEVKGVSWHVDVIVKPVGWLGTYRKSAVTGLWFAGRHHVHVQGT